MIPIEVLELCLDELAAHQGHSLTSRKALQACALVSRSLLPRSRHHLYSKIQITWTKDILISKVAHRIQGLRDVLRQNPSIVGHIHALELSIDREGVVTEPFNGLPAIIDMMFSYMLQNKSRRGLQELKLAGGDVPTVWSDLDVTFRQAIFRLMTSPTVNGITQFHLSQLSVFPVTLITHSTLRELTLNHVWFVDDDDWCRLGPLEISVYSYAEYPASKLTKLIANESISRFAIALNSPISSPETLPSSLTTLQAFAVQSRDVAWVRKIITAASETLDSLEIGGIIYGQARYIAELCYAIDLTKLPRLRRFTLNVNALTTRYCPKSITCPITLLDTLNFKNSGSISLQSIQINLRCGVRKPFLPLKQICLEDRACTTLGSILEGGKFPALRDVGISLSMGVGYGRECQEQRMNNDDQELLSTELDRHLRDCLLPLTDSSSVSTDLSVVVDLFVMS